MFPFVISLYSLCPESSMRILAFPLVLCFISFIVSKLLLTTKLPPEARKLQRNNNQMLSDQPWKRYQAWSRTLGPIFSMRPTIHLGSHFGWLAWILPAPDPTIILDGLNTITDLFQKQGENFSDRPRWPMAELLGRTENVGFTYYGGRLKRARALLQSEFGSHKRSQWAPSIEQAVQQLVDYWKVPEQCSGDEARRCLRRTLESLMFRLTYGFEPSADVLELIKEVNNQTGAAFQPGRWAVNSFPLLSHIPYWVPGAEFQRWAMTAKALFMKMVREPYEKTKVNHLDNSDISCFVVNHLRDMQWNGSVNSEPDERLIMSTAGSIFTAGVDTTIAAVETILVLLSRHPHDQQFALEEIVKTLSDERLTLEPTTGFIRLAEVENLPYVMSIIKEALRFNPPVPVLTHSPLKDSVYKGWQIPRGSWVLANIWSLFHTSSLYPSPNRFHPKRHYSSDALDPLKFAFGMGRRVCPGIHLAMAFTTLLVAQTIMTFSIEPVSLLADSAGHEEKDLSEIKFTTGLTSHPKVFSCKLVPRVAALAT
ncbi:cytochrome P450 [Rhodocollybia butyracea]|uniref:Cytochrome P450 n=1 Tax=Rhodocollybia butyracea TaxID=206335 RepID=A0A9P5TX65_9AGAR|nr:cytochrome P450 [Rhodocollybia butyracea]